jgi:hypothetical protein
VVIDLSREEQRCLGGIGLAILQVSPTVAHQPEVILAECRQDFFIPRGRSPMKKVVFEALAVGTR